MPDPTPSLTPEPSPTPRLTTSCNDQEAQKRVLEGFLRIHYLDRQSLGAWILNKIGNSRIRPLVFYIGGVEDNATPERVTIDTVILLGRFQISIDDGHGNCLVFAYRTDEPDESGGVHIFSALSDVTVDGVWGGMPNGLAQDLIGTYDLQSESGLLDWIQDNRGAPVRVSYYLRMSEADIQKATMFEDHPNAYFNQHGSVYKDIARSGYLLRYGSNDRLYEEEYMALHGPDKDVQYDPVSVSTVLGTRDTGLLLFLVESPVPTPTPSRPPRTPYPTWTPPPTPTPQPLSEYDAFDDSRFAGTYNPDLWILRDASVGTARQENGVMVLQKDEDADDLLLDALGTWTYEEGHYVQADVRLDEAQHDGTIRLAACGDMGAGHWYCAECALNPDAYFSCGFQADAGNGTIIRYESPGEGLYNNTWYTVRIEIDPQNHIFRYYLNGEPIGSYVPGDEDAMVGRQMHFFLSALGGPVTGRADNVAAGSAQW